MKHVLLGIAACTLSLAASAQHYQCGTDHMRAQRIAEDPTYLEREALLEQDLRELIRNSASETRGRDVVLTIPIVFHIIHLGGTENISNEQILNAVDLLNEDFRAMNADIGDVHPAFTDVVGDAMIQFALPTRDNLGGCTNGIDRIRTPETLRGSDKAKMNPWPRERYLNVWVVKDMENPEVAGYAYYPSAFDNAITRIADGIIIESSYIGEIGTGVPSRSTALTHEVGHYLNLAHVWGNNNGQEVGNPPIGHMVSDCGDDAVEDTPVTRGWSICPPFNDPNFGWGDCDRLSLTTFPYTFDGVTTSSGTTDPTTLAQPSDSIFGEPRQRSDMLPFSANGVGANSLEAGMFAFAGWDEVPVDGASAFNQLTGSINTSKYYSFTIDPRVTDLLYIDSIGFKVSRNAGGIRTFAVRSSQSNFQSNIPIRAAGNPNISVQTGNIAYITSDEALSNITVYADPPAGAGMFYTDQPVTFRLYAWNAESTNGRVTLCANAAPFDLFDVLGGQPMPGGTWSGPSDMDGIFDATTMEEGTYTYTVGGNGPCPQYTATVDVIIDNAVPDVPTISGQDSFCTGASVSLSSSASSNILWNTGATTSSISVSTGGSYTVTVTNTTSGCKATSEPFVLQQFEPVVAGANGALTLCETSEPVELALSLIGTPQSGGAWSGPSEVIDGLYDPNTMEPGTYTYSLDANGTCAAASAEVVVTETATANAGSDGTLSICNNRSQDLFERLGGAPQPGGVWTDATNNVFNGVYDASTMAPGTYTYTVTIDGGCGSSSAVVTVSEINAPAVPTITGVNSFCAGGTVALVSSINQGNVWSPGGVTTPVNNINTPGTYTVRVNQSNGCFSVSEPFVVTRIERVNAGNDAEMNACTAASDLDLFQVLGGTPQAGGAWSGPSQVIGGLYQPSSMQPGVYTYVVTATAPCPNDTALVKVTESENLTPTAGTFGVDELVVYGSTNLIENVQNYMEYSYCSNMFSNGQVERMRFALNSATGERNNLWTDDNLRVTGVAEGHRANCAPIADFYVRTAILGTNEQQEIPYIAAVCVGEPVQFMDNSVGGLPTSWQWTFEGGTPSTSTERNPVVTFDTPGLKNVTLVATNANGSNSKTDNSTFIVGGSPYDVYGLYSEGFENTTGISPWHTVNYAKNITSWRRTTVAGENSSACVMLNSGERNFLDIIDPANGADYDDFYSPTFDLSGLTQAALTFSWAYSTTTNELPLVTERLLVQISTDCGETWSLLPTGDLNQGTLINNGNNPQFPPPAWSQRTLNINEQRRVPNVRFRFRFISSEFSGNLYIDNINIIGAVGIEDLSSENFMSLFPNPTNDQFTLGVHGMDRFETRISITDLRGAVVYEDILRPSTRSMEFSATNLGLADGLYMINASNEAGRHTQKLMVGK